MSTFRPWPPPPRGAISLGPRELGLCSALEWLALLHVIAGLAWPLLVVGSTWLDRWIPEVAEHRFWAALIGPTIASWGLLFWFGARHGLRRGQRWVCHALIAAILTWLPLDFALCYAFRFWPGVVLDPLFGLTMLVLLLMLRPKLLVD